MLSRAVLRSVSGCPVAASLVLHGSIGPAVTLRLPLPFAGMLLVRSVCPAADCGAGGVGIIFLWIGRLCKLTWLLWTNALEASLW